MNSVFIVHHLHLHTDGRECIKLIGAYRCRKSALSAVARLKSQPGFCDYPKIIDPSVDIEESGFYIEEYRLDKDHWEEGFVTV